ncbi:MAG: prepilin-type N-terminal cleavage/methylation domain-containing protein [Phycisphaerae bacterium]|jgi:prepilin-type processing-associated H-X9-DG protein/prepilin-type N-terminal cleavage/methylation domain-containing protein
MKRHHPPGGFTLVELLVVVAVIALLLAILMPSLRNARWQAKRIACATQLSQLSIAHHLYGNDNGTLVPKGLSASGGAPWWNWTREDSGMPTAPNFVNYVANYKTIGSAFLFCPCDDHPYPAEKMGVPDDDPHWGAETSYSLNGWHKRAEPGSDKYILWGPAGHALSRIENPGDTMLMAETWRWAAIMDRVALETGTWDAHYEAHPTLPNHYPGNLEWDDNERHGGTLNFLFVDGHVRARTRSVGVPSAEESPRFWGPEYDSIHE